MVEPEDFLEHYGVKGQKWGVRKKSTSTVRGKTPGTRTYDPTKMSNKELKRVIERMKLEQEYERLNNPKKETGGKWVKEQIKKEGMKTLISVAKKHGPEMLATAAGFGGAAALTRIVK